MKLSSGQFAIINRYIGLKTFFKAQSQTRLCSKSPVCSADITQFPALVMQAGDNGFQLTEVSADKAYLSRANLALVDDYGATPFIPFKKSSIAKPMGGNRIWRKMYHYFSLNQDEFLAHYHAHSNVETSFMAIKRKFGDTLKAKTLPSQINELLCKVIAYNVVQVIHETHELGRDFSFLAERDGPPKGLIMTME